MPLLEHTACSSIFLDITCVYYFVMDFPSWRRTKHEQVRVNKDQATGQSMRPECLAWVPGPWALLLDPGSKHCLVKGHNHSIPGWSETHALDQVGLEFSVILLHQPLED